MRAAPHRLRGEEDEGGRVRMRMPAVERGMFGLAMAAAWAGPLVWLLTGGVVVCLREERINVYRVNRILNGLRLMRGSVTAPFGQSTKCNRQYHTFCGP